MKVNLKEKLKNNRRILLLLITIFFSIKTFSEEKYIASFNALRLGSNEKNYLETAAVIKDFEIVGLVEVMNRRGIEELTDALEKVSGEKWDYYITPYGHGKGSYKEYYGYVWKRETVKMLKPSGFYPDKNDDFVRPPFGAFFRLGEFDFILVMAHSIFGKNQSVRKAEAYNYDDVYDYFQSLDEKEKDVIIAGDFNLPADDESFWELTKKHADKIIAAVDPKLKTTIGTKGLANSYDNIFLSTIHTKEFQGKSGKYNFTEGKYEYSRKYISDHLPVFIAVEISEDDD